MADLERSYRFYKDGLEFPTTRTSEEGVVFFQTGGVALALYPYTALAEDVGRAGTIHHQNFRVSHWPTT